MRTDTLEFQDKNTANDQEPQIVVELSFDDANTDIHYITSHTINGITGNVISGALKNVSSTSQRLNPDKANSSIGSIRFECLDDGLTDLQQTKLNNGFGLKGKRVRVYVGYRGLLWSEFVPVQTQIISKAITYKDGVYTFNCSDIQRAMRKQLFIVKETVLTGSVAKDDSVIEVQNTTGFEKVFQPPTADSIAPSQEIGLLKISDGDNFELVMWTGKTSTSFTGCTRGMLGTPVLEFDVEPDETGASVEEFVYLSAPALMVSYALLTGSWYGYPGKFLPNHWHLGISTNYIKTSDFIGMPDLWDINDIDAGVVATVLGPTAEDGKKFIEEQLFLMISVYPPIDATGELGLKRITQVSALGAYDRELDEDNVVSYGVLTSDLGAIVNRYVIQWDYSLRRDIYQRTSVLIDQDSIDKHGVSNTKSIKLKTLFGSKDSLKVINSNFNAVTARYSTPPLKLPLVLTPDQNDLEVSDVVRVNLPAIRNLNRNFELQSTGIDWTTGRVSVNLFGTSQGAGLLTPDSTHAVDTTFLSKNVPAGNWLTPTNYPGLITSSNGTSHIVGNLTGANALVGLDDLNDLDCVYYCPEDLQIDSGFTVEINKNTQIRVEGYFTNNGTIDGKGNGYLGGDRSIPRYGIGGGVGSVGEHPELKFWQAGSGNKEYASPGRRKNRVEAPRNYRYSLPELVLKITDDLLRGLPTSLIGTTGNSAQGLRNIDAGTDAIEHGGVAGDSGAGLVIVSAGFNNGNGGFIDLSGTSGSVGASYAWQGTTLYAGSGQGGHNGGLVFISTDSAQFTESPSEFGTVLEIGEAPKPDAERLTKKTGVYPGRSYQASFGATQPAENTYESFAKIIYLDASLNYTQDLPDYVESEPTFTLTEYVNTPPTPAGNKSSIEVSVTPPPGDDNYSYAEVDWRVKGSGAWQTAPAASHESVVVATSNGDIIEVRVRPVSKANIATLTGEIKEITATDIYGRTDAALSLIYPFSAILGLSIQGEAGTVFTGIDSGFEWLHDNGEHNYFSHYEVEMWSGAQLLRTERSVSPFYVYSYTKNVADHLKLLGPRSEDTPGVYLDLTIKVKTVSRYYNNLGNLYSSPQFQFTVSASMVDDPDNLRFLQTSRDELIANFATVVTQSDLDGLQSQIDGNITSWFYSGVPTLANSPTSTWTSDELKDNHLGDLYYDDATQYAYRFRKSGSVYSWERLLDNDITTALGNAQNAQDTADSKRRVFVVTPTAPYDAGDLWTTGAVIKRSTISRATSYNAGDWIDIATLGATWGDNVDGQPSDEAIARTGFGAMHSGGFGDVTFTKNKIYSGVDNDGEIRVLGSRLYHPDGTVRAIENNKEISTPFEGATTQIVFYLMYTDTSPASRWAGWTVYGQSTTQFAPVIYDPTTDVWKAVSNNGAEYIFTPADTDLLVAIGGKPNAGGGIETLFSYIGVNSNLPDDGATVGADWDSNVANIPDEITASATLGLNITPTHMGYYNGSAFTTYMQNNGKLYLQGNASNYLYWDGSTLELKGLIEATSVKAGSSLSAPIISGGLFRTQTSGERTEILSSDNKIHCYWDSGDGTVRENVVIGNNGSGAAWAFETGIVIGNDDYEHRGMTIKCPNASGLFIDHGTSDKALSIESDSPFTAVSINVQNAANSTAFDVFSAGDYGITAYGDTAIRGNGRSPGYDFYAGGSGTNYGPFTGAHDALLPIVGPLYQEGDIVKISSIITRSTISNVLAEIEIQDTPDAKNSFGVLVWSKPLPDENHITSMESLTPSEYSAYKSTHLACSVNGVGEGQINVCDEGGDIDIGDHICSSSVLGKGKLYTGMDTRYVVARAIENVDWSTEVGTTKTIACIYMCG